MAKYLHSPVRFAKTGELSGDLCIKCGGFMIIDKTQNEYCGKNVRFKNKDTNRYMWTVRCQECGRETDYVSHADNESAYR